jgi:hypothetical protein
MNEKSDVRFPWSQMTWDPVFNDKLKKQFGCVSDEAFSENGKYQVDRLKTNLLALSLVGCGQGDKFNTNRDVSAFGVATDSNRVRPNDHMGWLCDVVKKELGLPLILKGILDPDDAVLARDNGADAIIVSNHGGRQVDGSISSVEALPGE